MHILFVGVLLTVSIKMLSKKFNVDFSKGWKERYNWSRAKFPIYWILSGLMWSIPIKSYLLFSGTLYDMLSFIVAGAAYVVIFGSLMGKIGLVSADIIPTRLVDDSFVNSRFWRSSYDPPPKILGGNDGPNSR